MPRLFLAAVVALVAASAACGDDVPSRGRIAVESSAFRDGGQIPERFSCEGENVPPPLSIENVPPGTVELVLVVTDPDAPDGTFYHWLVAGLPSSTRTIGGELPPGAVQAAGSSGLPAYIGPCPPDGDGSHRYRFTVYSLERASGIAAGDDAARAARRVAAEATATGTLTGRFGR